MKALPLTIRCDCGEVGHVSHGERWVCERCGRSYDTTALPDDEYRAVRAIQRRYFVGGWIAAGAVALFVLFLAISNQPLQVAAGLPIILIAWFTYVRPILRRRYRRALAKAGSTWQVEADAAGESGTNPPRGGKPRRPSQSV
jgi:hypothetical protein